MTTPCLEYLAKFSSLDWTLQLTLRHVAKLTLFSSVAIGIGLDQSHIFTKEAREVTDLC